MIKIKKARFNKFMRSRRWNKVDLAKAMHFSGSSISLFLNEVRPPSRKFMDRSVQVTGLTWGDLFFCSNTYQRVRSVKSKIQKSNYNAQ